VASKNGGGRSVDDEFPDDEPVDELEDAEDEDVDDLDDADEDDDDFEDEYEDDEELEEEAPVGRRRSVATSRASAKASVARTRTTARTRKDTETRPGLIGRFINFVREVVAELQKVIWPTRKELLTYTTVVIVFVTIVMSFVAGLDVGFAKLMFLVFGNPDAATGSN